MKYCPISQGGGGGKRGEGRGGEGLMKGSAKQENIAC